MTTFPLMPPLIEVDEYISNTHVWGAYHIGYFDRVASVKGKQFLEYYLYLRNKKKPIYIKHDQLKVLLKQLKKGKKFIKI